MLRPWNPATDYPALAAMQTAAQARAVTPDELRETDEGVFLSKGLLHRLVAVGDDGRTITGYLEAFRYSTTVPGKFYAAVVTAPALRGRGIGSALVAELDRFAVEQQATRLVADVRDDDATSLAFAQKRGYTIERQGFDSVLDLTTFSESVFAGVVDSVAASGIRFFTLADRPGESTEHQLYELYKATFQDLPGYESTGFMPMATWRHLVVENPRARPDWVIIAADGDRLVGVTTLIDREDHVYTNHTLVDREYRGRKIAVALKLLSIWAAKAHGASSMRTGNDSLNGPMLAVNRKLGYVPLTGFYAVVKYLTPQ
jgi:GNAT superfamily N-acetyltransferase